MIPRQIGSESRADDQVQVAYDSSSNIEYVGNASPGVLTSDSEWRIKKITYDVDNNMETIKWAGGTPAYVNVWDNRASLSYS